MKQDAWSFTDKEVEDARQLSNIVRVKKDERYFVASNVPFNDERLTWEARGIMGYLLSKPNDWQVRMGDLVNKGPAGMKIIRRVLAELRQYGYMKREKVLGEHGHFVWVTTLYESPELNKDKNSTILPSRIDAQSIDAQRVDILSTEKQNTNKPLSAASKKKIITSANKTVDSILATEKQSSGKSWTNLPANYHEYGKAFCEATGLNYHKKYMFDWIETFDEWQNDGFTANDVTRAVNACKGVTNIHRPGSITWKLRGQKVDSPKTYAMELVE